MRLLDRYLLREFLIPLGFCLIGFLIFLIASDLFTQLNSMLSKQLRAGDVAAYYLFKAPELLILVIPVALLLALLYTLATHARHNEVTAIRTAGVSLWRMCLPYLAVGIAGTAALFLVNEFVVPRTAEMAQQILAGRAKAVTARQRQLVENVLLPNPAEGRIWRIGVYNLATKEMTQPSIQWRLRDGSRRSIYAERAFRTNHVWMFQQVTELRVDSSSTNAIAIRLPVSEFKVFPELSETPEMIRDEIDLTERLQRGVRPGRTHRADIPVFKIVRYLSRHPNLERSLRRWLDTRLHGRIAAPWACVVVVLIAVPFAAGSGRRNVFVGVAGSLLFCFAYFLLQQVGFFFGSAGYVPAWLGAWFPNLFFAAVGLVMMYRVR